MVSGPLPAEGTDVVIFGVSELASLAWYVLTHDSPHRVVAFTVDAPFRTQDHLHGLPVVDFTELPERFPAPRYALHLPIGWKRMNALRAEKLALARGLGYPIASYVSSRALVWPDLQHGENCTIHERGAVGPFARIGDNCMILSGAGVGHHVQVGDSCYLAARTTVMGGATIGEHCVLGGGSIVLDGVRVAAGCFIAAGALVTRDTEAGGVYAGAPAVRRKVPAIRLPLVR